LLNKIKVVASYKVRNDGCNTAAAAAAAFSDRGGRLAAKA
jgi:hypothetical protein